MPISKTGALPLGYALKINTEREGIEPTTFGFGDHYSTTELPFFFVFSISLIGFEPIFLPL
jgi:hypothetical protein